MTENSQAFKMSIDEGTLYQRAEKVSALISGRVKLSKRSIPEFYLFLIPFLFFSLRIISSFSMGHFFFFTIRYYY